MTKKLFQVISNKYVVDKEANIQRGDIIVSKPLLSTILIVEEIDKYVFRGQVTVSEEEHITNGKIQVTIKSSNKIIATIGETNRIGNLPVIEFEDNIESIFFREFPIPKSHWPSNQKFDYESGRVGFMRAYQIVKKEGCWTDEDMQKFAEWIEQNMFIVGERLRFKLNSKAEPKDAHTWYTYQDCLNFYKESLKQPKEIKEVELETEYFGHPFHVEVLKITKAIDSGDVIIIQK